MHALLSQAGFIVQVYQQKLWYILVLSTMYSLALNYPNNIRWRMQINKQPDRQFLLVYC